ncbi:hypothetical protein [Patulibacter sp. SYSU D01012]|uniref:hypothetical protein n=1 Tax=Patulibacter sp. SYSU D01012 TaxID=2817381 RepID=UPI001B30B5C8|nr:hypothetical protein [Patulibacter sp. SYSU D01012]
MTRRPLRTALVAAALALAAVPATASAAGSIEIGMADDNVLNGVIDGGPVPGGQDATLQKWKDSGVQDVRLFAKWDTMAPDAGATKPPAGKDLADPATYDFSGLDARINLVRKHGLNITLVVTGQAPVWGSQEPARRKAVWKPDPKKFGKFAEAVTKHVAARVDRYIVWNEPNVGTWLQPQYECAGTKCTPYAPHLYRELARAGYAAIHANDDVARVGIGATSSKGNALAKGVATPMQPMVFLREMACVTSKYKATRKGACKTFKPVTGETLAYHPHSSTISPGTKDKDPGNARMGDLSRLTTVIDKLTAKKRVKVKGAKRLPLWLDEYAYETNPPDTAHKEFPSPKTAATWSQWAWSIAARNPRVELLTQYEWFDESTKVDEGRVANRWQSGLYYIDGSPKPLAQVFAHPIFGWRTSKNGYVWGQVRPGDVALDVRVQRRSGSSWQDVKTVRTNANGLFQLRVPASSSAKYRYVYVDPVSGQEAASASTTLRKG